MDGIKFNLKKLMAISINLLVKCFVICAYQLISEISVITNEDVFCAEMCSLQNRIFLAWLNPYVTKDIETILVF